MASLLIVDDEERVRNILSEQFSEEYQCQTAHTADEALTLIASQSFDVIITDLLMPGMRGEDFIGILRTAQPRTPVIVISGAANRSHAEGLIIKGVFDYLLKPFHLQDIVEKVERAMEYRRRLTQNSGV